MTTTGAPMAEAQPTNEAPQASSTFEELLAKIIASKEGRVSQIRERREGDSVQAQKPEEHDSQKSSARQEASRVLSRVKQRSARAEMEIALTQGEIRSNLDELKQVYTKLEEAGDKSLVRSAVDGEIIQQERLLKVAEKAPGTVFSSASPILAFGVELLGEKAVSNIGIEFFSTLDGLVHFAQQYRINASSLEKKRYQRFGHKLRELALFLGAHESLGDQEIQAKLKALYNAGVAIEQSGGNVEEIDVDAFASKQKVFELLVFLTTGQDVSEIQGEDEWREFDKNLPRAYRLISDEKPEERIERLSRSMAERIRLLGGPLLQSITSGRAIQNIAREAGVYKEVSTRARQKVVAEALGPGLEDALGEDSAETQQKLSAMAEKLLVNADNSYDKIKILTELVSDYKTSKGESVAEHYRLSSLFNDGNAELICTKYDYLLAALLREHGIFDDYNIAADPQVRIIPADLNNNKKSDVQGHVRLVAISKTDKDSHGLPRVFIIDPTDKNAAVIEVTDLAQKTSILSKYGEDSENGRDSTRVFRQLESHIVYNLRLYLDPDLPDEERKRNMFLEQAGQIDPENPFVLLERAQKKGDREQFNWLVERLFPELSKRQVDDLFKKVASNQLAVRDIVYFERGFDRLDRFFVEDLHPGYRGPYPPRSGSPEEEAYIKARTDYLNGIGTTSLGQNAEREEMLLKDIQDMFETIELNKETINRYAISSFQIYLNLASKLYAKVATGTPKEISQKRDEVAAEVIARVMLYESDRMISGDFAQYFGLIREYQKNPSNQMLLEIMSIPGVSQAMHAREQCMQQEQRCEGSTDSRIIRTGRTGALVTQEVIARVDTEAQKTVREYLQILYPRFTSKQLDIRAKRAAGIAKRIQGNMLDIARWGVDSDIPGKYDEFGIDRRERPNKSAQFLVLGQAQSLAVEAMDPFTIFELDYTATPFARRMAAHVDLAVAKDQYYVPSFLSWAPGRSAIVNILEELRLGDFALAVQLRHYSSNRAKSMIILEKIARFEPTTLLHKLYRHSEAFIDDVIIAHGTGATRKDKFDAGWVLFDSIDKKLFQLQNLSESQIYEDITKSGYTAGGVIRSRLDPSTALSTIALTQEEMNMYIAMQHFINARHNEILTNNHILPHGQPTRFNRDVIFSNDVPWSIFFLRGLPGFISLSERLGHNYLATITGKMIAADKSAKAIHAALFFPSKENITKMTEVLDWMDEPGESGFGEKREFIGRFERARIQMIKHSFISEVAPIKMFGNKAIKEIPALYKPVQFINFLATFLVFPRISSEARRLQGWLGESFDLEVLIREVNELVQKDVITRKVGDQIIKDLQFIFVFRSVPFIQLFVAALFVGISHELLGVFTLQKE